MRHSIKVDLTCPLCPDEMGVLTATCSPDAIDDLVDAGCGHSESLWKRLPADLERQVWDAVAGKEYDAYLDAQDSRFSAWRDR